MHVAGLGVHRDIGHMRAADAAGDEVVISTLALADAGDGSRAELCTGLLPGDGLVGTALDANVSAKGFQFLGFHPERWGHFFHELVQSGRRSAAGGRTHAAYRCGTAGRSVRGIFRIANVYFYCFERQAHRLSRDDADDRPSTGSEILRT